MMPYICVDLNLDEQLINLSTAAHMAFFLYRDGCAHTQFMLTQSYVNIMIMIKNIYYCVAKAKVDNPHSKFYPILLGVDCLETFFGLIQTVIGTDANVDILQLGSRALGLTEVTFILAENPEWDPSPRRLMLPHIGKDIHAGEIISKFDHISPKDWRSNATVARVNLHSCWLLGCQQAITCIPESGSVFENLLAKSDPSINMLSPLGTLLVNQHNQDPNAEDLNADDLTHNLSPKPIPSGAMQGVHSNQTSHSYMHNGDLEDAMADEMPRNNVGSAIIMQGQKTSKAKALCNQMAFCSTWSLTDRLRHVQNIPCFGPNISADEPDSWSGLTTSCNDITLGPTLCVGNPVALLVRCNALVVLAVAQVNQLWFASYPNLDKLAVVTERRVNAYYMVVTNIVSSN